MLMYSTTSTMWGILWGRPDDDDEWNISSISIASSCAAEVLIAALCVCMYVRRGMVVFPYYVPLNYMYM